MAKTPKNPETVTITKSDVATISAETTNQSLIIRAQAMAALSSQERLQALKEALDVSPEDVETIAAGALPFWPALSGLMLVGTISAFAERETRLIDKETGGKLTAGFYTFTLDRPAVAATPDGELLELSKGESITVLERTVLQELRSRIGQKVGVLNNGKKMSKNGFEYWDYQVVGVRSSAPQLTAGDHGKPVPAQLES